MKEKKISKRVQTDGQRGALENLLKMALILCGSSALRCGWKAGRRLRPPLRLLFIRVFISNTPINSVRAIAVGDCA